MSLFAEAIPAKAPRTPQSQLMARLLAGFLVVMATAQLFEFDAFLTLLATFGLPMNMLAAYILGGIIVVSEVFSLPFLLQLPLSRAFRWVSVACVWLATGVWLAVSLWIMISSATVDSVGMLGFIPLAPGWWAVLLSLALCILAAWATWGLWPGKRK